MSGYDEIRGRDNRMRGDDVCDHLKQEGDHCEECEGMSEPMIGQCKCGASLTVNHLKACPLKGKECEHEWMFGDDILVLKTSRWSTLEAWV